MNLTVDDILRIERESIETFIRSVSPHITGRVLDYGCGKQPYRELIESFGCDYVGYDRALYPANVSGEDVGPEEALFDPWDTILCNQVIQYVPDPMSLLREMRGAIEPGGCLIMTGPTNWREIEPDDLHRFTLRGITRLLTLATFDVEIAESRTAFDIAPGFVLSFGWGVLARA